MKEEIIRNKESIENEESIRIEDILSIVMKRWKMILSITVIATLTATIISFFVIAPKYEASTKVFIGKETAESETYDNNDVQMYQKLLKTYSEVVTTYDLIEKAINADNLNITSEEVLGSLTVTPRADTQIVEIQYVNTDRILARDVVNSVTKQFIKSSTELIPNGNVKIIQNVRIPENPVSPNKKMNIAVAFLLGLMISIGLSFALEFMNNTFKTQEQMEDVLGLPVLGAIPNSINY